MTTLQTVGAGLLAIGATILLALPGTASAAIVTPLPGPVPGLHVSTTPVHWVWRHHHRYWVPDRRDNHDHR